MLHALVAENCSAPGTADFVLAGAAAGSVTWGTRFTNGQPCFYLATDGGSPPKYEGGIGTYTTGPATVTRGTVTENSSNTTAKINFTGPIKVQNFLASDNAVYVNNSGVVALAVPLTVAGLTSISKSGSGSVLTIGNPSNTGADGAQIKFDGTNFDAYMRVNQASAGEVQLMNAANSLATLTVGQTGNVSCPGTLTSTGKAHAAAGTTGSDLLRFDQFPATLSATQGTAKLATGLIIKWHTITVVGGIGSQGWTFTVPFPNNIFGCWAIPNSPVLVQRFGTSLVTDCGFLVREANGATPAGSIVLNCFAIGN